MKTSTAVTVTALALCGTVANAKMETVVKRDNATEGAPLVKRENVRLIDYHYPQWKAIR